MSEALKSLFFIGDFVLLNLAIFLSIYWSGLSITTLNPGEVYLIVFSNLSWLFLVLVSLPYEGTRGWTVSKTLRSQFAFISIHLLVIASLIVFFDKQYNPFQILLIYLIFIPLFFIFRLVVFYFRRLTISNSFQRRYILIGRNELAEDVRKYYLLNPDLGYQFVRYFDFVEGDFDLNDIRSYCSDFNIHEIYFCSPEANKQKLELLVNFGLDSLIKVKLIVDAGESANHSVQLDEHSKMPGKNRSMISLDDYQNRLIKRGFDLLFASILFILVLSWLIPLIILLIKLDSKGSAFFIQLRNGEGNRPFGCIKFRTMLINNEADIRQATKNDPRITRVGALLRKSSIDELPQFINVFKGDMSVIGPRPHPIKLNEKFAPLISSLMSRHYVKPGITGLAQCMGYRGETKTLADMENRVRLDRYYIENWTFWLDIKIIFLTVVSLIRGSDKAF
jgi:exopolysaccharide biosynthesis polyprenyl glycosylphosphotransferase